MHVMRIHHVGPRGISTLPVLSPEGCLCGDEDRVEHPTTILYLSWQNNG